MHNPPDTPVNWGKKPPKSDIKADTPCKKSNQIPHSQIPAADSESQFQPGGIQYRQKQQIGKGGMLWTKGAQKSIPDSDSRTQRQGSQKSLGCQLGRRHFSKRLSQPPSARGSS